MNTAIRGLTLIGMSLVTAASIGAGPVQAAPSTEPVPAAPAAVQVVQPHDDEDVVGYYRMRRACERAGRIGVWNDRWESYECERVRWGFRRGFWKLVVERDWDWSDRPRPGHDDDDDDDHHGGPPRP